MTAFDRFLAARLVEINALQTPFWAKDADLCAEVFSQVPDFGTPEYAYDIVHALYLTQRLRRITKANLHENVAFKTVYDATVASSPVPHPDNILHNVEGFDEQLVWRVMDQVYSGVQKQRTGSPDRGMMILRSDELLVHFFAHFADRANNDDQDFIVNLTDSADWKDIILNHIHPEYLEAYANDMDDITQDVTHSFVLTYETRVKEKLFNPPFTIDDVTTAQFNKLGKGTGLQFKARTMKGDIPYCLSHIPTPLDAARENISYGEYLRIFAAACDQPEDLTHPAQEEFIRRLDAGETMRFTNTDGTDLIMSIKGFTFCNSTTYRNVPGSEVFSAPELTSLNGRIVSKGRFCPSDDDATKVVENITLVFKNGVIDMEQSGAETGWDILREILEEDISHRRAGEIGIGTNAMLKYAFTSILLSEKTSQSFHIALGSCYNYKQYLGKPVNVDNGNKSPRGWHWDMTTILGDMELDGVKIMENGQFLDPAFNVFNEGWNIVTPSERPEWCKNGMIPYRGPKLS